VGRATMALPKRCSDFRGAFSSEEVARTPEEVGLDSSRLESLSRWMETLVDTGNLPCASALVARQGRVAYCKGTGWQTPGKEALREDTIYRIYSMTKPIVSMALLMLHEEGRCHIHQPVHLWLGPKWKRKNMRVYRGGSAKEPLFEDCEKTITIKHLLTHTSGLAYGLPGSELVNPVDRLYQRELKALSKSGPISLAEFTESFLPGLPLCFQPGSRWLYSYATDVIGHLVEVISGEPLAKFLQQRILGPLRMTDTMFSADLDEERQASRLATCHIAPVPGSSGAQSDVPGHTSEAALARAKRAGAIGPPPRLAAVSQQQLAGEYFRGPSAGGGMVSTLHDYWRFAQCILNGGALDGVRVLSRMTVDWATSNHLPGNAAMIDMALPGFAEVTTPATGFGLGFSVVMDGLQSGFTASTGTLAWGGMASTLFWIDPREKLIVVFMTQVIGHDRFRLPLRLLLENLVSGTVIGPPAVRDSLPNGDVMRSRL